MINKAVILAAGIGSRLRPLTDKKPKCMAKLAGIPILIRQIDSFRLAGIKTIFIATGYKSEMVNDCIKNVKDVEIILVNNPLYETTNNMYSLYLIMSQKKLLGEPFILANGDVGYEPSIISDVIESEEKDLIACDKGDFNDESMKITVGPSGFVENINKSIKKELAYGTSIDLYKFSEDSGIILYDTIKAIIEEEKILNEWTEVALQKMLFSGKWKAKPYDIRDRNWVEVDDFEDLKKGDLLFSNIRSLRDKKGFFIDLDGTIYLGEKIINGSREFIESLRSKEKSLFFLSNNSSKSKKDYMQKLSGLGIDAKEHEIILSTDGLINYLVERKVKNVFTLGTQSLKEQIGKNNINPESSDPDLVIIGYDTELNYEKLVKASAYIYKGRDYIATHCDIVCPTEFGPVPDAGTMIKMIEMTTGKPPLKIFGKPNKEMVSHIIMEKGYIPSELVFIGDRLYTDMVLAKRIGSPFILTLSGEAKREEVEDLNVFPDLIVENVGVLVNFI